MTTALTRARALLDQAPPAVIPGQLTAPDPHHRPQRTDQEHSVTEIRIPIEPLTLTAGTFTELVFLDPNRPHTVVDERGCPDCGGPYYDSGCGAPGCNGCACSDCGTGCDLDFVDAEDGGRCAQALDREAATEDDDTP